MRWARRRGEFSGVSVGTDMERFRAKARQFLQANGSHIAILKLRRNDPLTAIDLSELERIFAEAGVGGPEGHCSHPGGRWVLAIFVRSLVGLDRAAAKRVFDGFLQGRNLTAQQHEFIDMMIDHLTERGVMDPRVFSMRRRLPTLIRLASPVYRRTRGGSADQNT